MLERILTMKNTSRTTGRAQLMPSRFVTALQQPPYARHAAVGAELTPREQREPVSQMLSIEVMWSFIFTAVIHLDGLQVE